MFIFFTILLITFVVYAIYGVAVGDEDQFFGGFFLSVLVIIFGFGGWGLSIDHTSKVLLTKDQYEILKAKNYVVFSVSEKLSIQSTEYQIVAHPDTVKVYKIIDYNHYNNPTAKSPYLEIQP